MKSRNKAEYAKIMVAMQMTDKNMIKIPVFDAIFDHLHLGSFAAIDHQLHVSQLHNLTGRVLMGCGDRGTISQDSYLKI
jgi:hypothetical protein